MHVVIFLTFSKLCYRVYKKKIRLISCQGCTFMMRGCDYIIFKFENIDVSFVSSEKAGV